MIPEGAEEFISDGMPALRFVDEDGDIIELRIVDGASFQWRLDQGNGFDGWTLRTTATLAPSGARPWLRAQWAKLEAEPATEAAAGDDALAMLTSITIDDSVKVLEEALEGEDYTVHDVGGVACVHLPAVLAELRRLQGVVRRQKQELITRRLRIEELQRPARTGSARELLTKHGWPKPSPERQRENLERNLDDLCPSVPARAEMGEEG